MDLSISIVSFNTKDHLEKCLSSIKKHTKHISYEIIVVDNNSEDGSPEMVKKKFSEATLIKNKTNKYFSKANNQAFQKAKGKYFLILNSDTYFVDNSLKKFIEYMDQNSSVGAAEGLELYEDGRVVPTGSLETTPWIDFQELSVLGKRLKNKKEISRFRLQKYSRKTSFEVDVACDAFMIIRSELFKKMGMYDTRLSLYYTENDLCKRIKKLGYKIMHFAPAKVYHSVSVSADKLGWRKSDIYYTDLKNYYVKHGHIISANLLYAILKTEQRLLKIRDKLFHQAHKAKK